MIFRRTDLDGFELEAVSRNVARVSYAAGFLMKGVFISTTEHLLSALIRRGIDNAIVELDNLELPILDGSALPFVEAIHKAGIRKQRRPRTYLRIRRELEVREGDKFIAVYPADTYSVSYAINFPHPLIGKETFRVDLSDGNYLSETAAARTFGFLHEADAMRQQGLIRGASQENAIVLTRDGLMNPPLRFHDEFVRHKVLDLIGDLALLGKADSGERGSRPRRTRHAYRAGLPHPRDRTLWEETTVEEKRKRSPALTKRPCSRSYKRPPYGGRFVFLLHLVIPTSTSCHPEQFWLALGASQGRRGTWALAAAALRPCAAQTKSPLLPSPRKRGSGRRSE